MKHYTLILITLVLTFSCTTTMNNPEKWNEEQLKNWFDKQEWMNSWAIQPDQSINKRNLAIATHKYPERWNKVFGFLAENDLSNLEIGKYEIDRDNAFALISEYTSKNREDAKFESHQKYIDIQYVIEGEELIGIAPIEGLKETAPYSPEKDIT